MILGGFTMKVPLWLDTVSIPSYQSLDQNIDVDICIVGAGITGITLAYLLRDSGLNIALIDSDQVLHGTTAYTTAKLTAGHGLIYADLIKNFGLESAKSYYQSQQDAIDFVVKTISDLKIECNLVKLPHYVYTQRSSEASKVQKEYEACRSLEIDCELVEDLGLPFSIEKAIGFKDSFQFHPLKYLTALLKEISQYTNISIFEQTTARDMTIEEDIATILTGNDSVIRAKKVVQACHFPFYDGGSLLFSKIEVSHSYLIAVDHVTPLPQGMYISYEKPTRSIRTFNDLLLIGGEDHLPGTVKDTSQKYQALIEFSRQYFNSDSIIYEWSTQDYMSIDQMPYVGSLHKGNQQQFVATGYCKWGMSNGTAAALVLNDLVRGIESPYASLFAPSRLNSKMGLKNLVVYNSKIAFEYLKGKLNDEDKVFNLEPDQSTTIKTEDGKYGIYKDLEGDVFMLDLTCPHLGCELAFNTAERTWDCPCHGSRFSYKGEIIEGPAHDSLTCHHNKIDPNVIK